VVAEFDPDVKDLLEELANATSVAEPPAKIAELNRFVLRRSLRSTSDVVTDVADVDGRIDTYRNRYREQLIALVHSSVPDVTRFQPEVLPSIDDYFYRHDYPGASTAGTSIETSFPQSPGSSGECSWSTWADDGSPARTSKSPASRSKGKVWLPFLRAKHYLATKESALQHSLTQFYRIASLS
jgi:hypothetical protein